MKEVKVRIAPSPTGDPHVGTAYIALFNYVFAKSQGGKFVIRIEDTDRERSNRSSEELILKYLDWLGLKWDEGPYKQSERKEIYEEYANKLVESGAAYRCYCSSDRLAKLRDLQRSQNLPTGYDGRCRDANNSGKEEQDYVIRLRVPRKGQTKVVDKIRGEVTFENIRIDDQVLLKSDGFPTYHLANVVDDHLMGITHVIRAEEWLPSTPKHIILYEAFGWDAPTWVHMPLLRNSDKSKISKRKNAVSLEYYHNQGYLKEAILNFLALMGWSLDGSTEKFTIDQMIEAFDWKSVSLGGPIFDINKLNWLNRSYMKSYDLKELMELFKPFYISKYGNIEDYNLVEKAVINLRDKSYTLVEMADDMAIYVKSPLHFLSLLSEGDSKRAREILSDPSAKLVVEKFVKKIERSDGGDGVMKEHLNSIKEELNLPSSKVFPVIRILISGGLKGGDLSHLLDAFGRDMVLRRIGETRHLLN